MPMNNCANYAKICKIFILYYDRHYKNKGSIFYFTVLIDLPCI